MKKIYIQKNIYKGHIHRGDIYKKGYIHRKNLYTKEIYSQKDIYTELQI